MSIQNKGTVFLLSTSVFLVTTGFSIIFPILPKLLDRIGAGAFEFGILAASFGVTFTIFSPIFGYIGDRRPKRLVIQIGLFGFLFSNFFYILADNLILLIIGRMVQGIFASAVMPSAISLVTDIVPDNEKGKNIGYIMAGNATGFIVGPSIGGILYDFSVYTPFYTSIGLSIFTLILTFKLIPNIQPITNHNGEDNQKLPFSWQAIPSPLIVFAGFVVVDIIYSVSWLFIEPGFIYYFYDDLHYTPFEFGIFVGAYGLAITVVQLLFGSLSDKFGRRPIIMLGTIFYTIFIVMLYYNTSLFSLIIAATFAGIGGGFSLPAMKALLADAVDDHQKTTVFGIETGLL
ncbi:MAG: MFS transporter, partial [Candidatus Heimdallarchaeota archaeon]|nr:MFS transporter [Candidatus Heimdallarchaeota archaeon]